MNDNWFVELMSLKSRKGLYMASTSSTTVMVDEMPSKFSCFRSVIARESLTDLISVVSRDACVSAWMALPLTERLELADSLISSMQTERSNGEILFSCLSILAMFSHTGDIGQNVTAQKMVKSALDQLLYVCPPTATAHSDIKNFRNSLRPVHHYRWMLISVGIAACLILAPRLTYSQ